MKVSYWFDYRRFKEILKQSGVTQKELADKTEILYPSKISLYLSGKETPSKKTLEILVWALNELTGSAFSVNDFYFQKCVFSSLFKERINKGERLDLKKWIFAFDMDNLIVQGKDFKYSWQIIWRDLYGSIEGEKLRQYYFQLYLRGNISYDTWNRICVDMFKNKKLHKDDLDRIIKKHNLKVIDGFLEGTEFLKSLRDFKFYIGIISGGIDVFLRKLCPICIEKMDFFYANSFIFNEKGYLSDIVPTKFDFERKLDALFELSDSLKVPHSYALFFGEGINDGYIFDNERYRGTDSKPIICSVNPIDERLKYADIVIRASNFFDILDCIFIAFNLNDLKNELRALKKVERWEIF